ncbi:MAG: DUF5947 family protein [Deltaproteobacteria bacterium]
MTLKRSSEGNPFSTLKRFIREKSPEERCDMCGLGIRPQHPHLIDLSNRRIVCACDACALLFSYSGDVKFKRVPAFPLILTDFQMSDADWDTLLIPISMAFLFNNSQTGKVHAMYPSPAGATESLLTLESWEEIVAANPALEAMEADVEALLVNRVGSARDYFIAPIDECYKLVGIIRSRWKGLSGGSEVWSEIKRFFDELRDKSTPRAGLKGDANA